MAISLYLRIPAGERKAYERRGWLFVSNLWPLKGQCLVKKSIKS